MAVRLEFGRITSDLVKDVGLLPGDLIWTGDASFALFDKAQDLYRRVFKAIKMNPDGTADKDNGIVVIRGSTFEWLSDEEQVEMLEKVKKNFGKESKPRPSKDQKLLRKELKKYKADKRKLQEESMNDEMLD